MANLTDVRFETLRALGYSGATSDMLLSWLQAGGPAVGPVTGPLNTIPDAWNSVLVQLNEENPFCVAPIINYVLDEDFSAADILRFEDTFNRADPAPWTAAEDAELDIEFSRLLITKIPGNAASGRAVLARTYVVGQWYKLTAERVGGNTLARDMAVSPDTSISNAIAQVSVPPGETKSLYFQATQTSLNVLLLTGEVAGATATWDNVKIEEVPALDGADDTSTGGSIEISNGAVLLTRGAGPSERPSLTWALTVEQNTNYMLKFLNGTEGGVIQALVGSFSEGFDLLDVNGNQGGTSVLSFNSSANTTVYLTLRNSLDNSAVTVDNITVQESLLANPTFDTDLSGWNATSSGGSSVTWEAGAARLIRVGSDLAFLDQSTGVGLGSPVSITIKIDEVLGGGVTLWLGAVGTGFSLGTIDQAAGPGIYRLNGTIPAGAATDNLIIYANGDGANTLVDYAIVDECVPTSPDHYHRNDWWYLYLGQQGYTGQMNDRELGYWLDLFQTTTGGAYSDAFGTGFG